MACCMQQQTKRIKLVDEPISSANCLAFTGCTSFRLPIVNLPEQPAILNRKFLNKSCVEHGSDEPLSACQQSNSTGWCEQIVPNHVQSDRPLGEIARQIYSGTDSRWRLQCHQWILQPCGTLEQPGQMERYADKQPPNVEKTNISYFGYGVTMRKKHI